MILFLTGENGWNVLIGKIEIAKKKIYSSHLHLFFLSI